MLDIVKSMFKDLTSSTNIRMPVTIAFEFGFPTAMYEYDEEMDETLEKKGSCLESMAIFDRLTENVTSTSTCCCYFLGIMTASTTLSINYMTKSDLDTFLFWKKNKGDGILQAIPLLSDTEENNHLLRLKVLWTQSQSCYSLYLNIWVI